MRRGYVGTGIRGVRRTIQAVLMPRVVRFDNFLVERQTVGKSKANSPTSTKSSAYASPSLPALLPGTQLPHNYQLAPMPHAGGPPAKSTLGHEQTGEAA